MVGDRVNNDIRILVFWRQLWRKRAMKCVGRPACNEMRAKDDARRKRADANERLAYFAEKSGGRCEK